MYCARSMKKTNVIYLYARHLPPVYICIVLDVSKQVECLVALCRTYVEVLLGGQSSSYVQTTFLVFLCCEATGG